MHVLVTGDGGYIGAELVPVLEEAGHSVVGLDIGLYDGCDFVRQPVDIPRVEVDVRDVSPQHLDGFDAVIHLAALSNDPLGDLDSHLTYDINLEASVRLAAAAKDAGVRRFLFSSSCSLYGAGGDAPLAEDAAFAPVTPYGESKVLAEQRISELASDDFSPVYLRNATAYGVSRRLRADIVVNNLVGYAVATGQVLLQSDGMAWRPLVHLRDIISAFLACLDAPTEVIHDQAFNVGRTGENYRIRDVADMVAEVVPGCEVKFASTASADTRNYQIDFSKIERELPGYEPSWTVHDGIVELYQAYTSAELTAAEWNSSRYYRLKTVQERTASGQLSTDLRWIRAG